jgi:hypothetical protein
VESSKIKQAVYYRAQTLENIGIKNTCTKTKLLEEEQEKKQIDDKMTDKTGPPNGH